MSGPDPPLHTKVNVTPVKAICLAIAGFTCWVLCDSAIKLAGQSRLPNYEIVGFLGISMMIFMALYAIGRGETSAALWPKKPGRVLVRASLDVMNNLCVVIALRHLSLTLFYILVFTSPMLVAILGQVFLKELLDWRKAGAISIGFIGVAIAVYPSRSNGTSDWVGLVACAACATAFSIAVVWSRVLSQTERPESMTFFSGLASAAVGVLGMIAYAVPVNGRVIVALLAMGLLGSLGNICIFVALKYAHASTVSQYHYTQLLTGAIVANLLFHEVPTTWMLAGSILIIASGVYIALRSAKGPVDEFAQK